MAFSTDSVLLASASADRTGRVWRISNHDLVQSFSMRSEILATAISSDNSMLALGDASGNRGIWRLSDGAQVVPTEWDEGVQGQAVTALSFSPDDELFARARTQWRLSITRKEFPPLPFPQEPYSATISGDFPYPEVVPVYDVQFSRDGNWLAAGLSDSTVAVYRMTEGFEERVLRGHSGNIASVEFSPDSRMLATVATDGDARLWSLPGGELIRTIRGAGGPQHDPFRPRGRFSADGKCLVTLSNETIRFWSVSDGRLLLTYPNLEAFSLAVSRDGKYFAYGTGVIGATNAAVVLARMPLLITDVSRTDGQLVLGWSGGGGEYQLQSTTDLVAGPWQDVGQPTTATTATNPVPTTTTYYRVKTLSGP